MRHSPPRMAPLRPVPFRPVPRIPVPAHRRSGRRCAVRRSRHRRSPCRPQKVDRGWEAEDAGPAVTEERPRRRQAEPRGQAATGASRRRRIERGPVRAGDAPPPGGLAEGDAPAPGMPEEEAPPARRPFRLMPHMITRPAFVTNVGLAGMLAGLSLSPSSGMAQDAPDMALALPQMPGSGPMGGSLPMYPPFAGAGPLPMSPAQGGGTPLGVPAFMPTVTPLVSAAAMPPPSTVWLGMPAPAPPPPDGGPDAAAPGALASPSMQVVSTPGVVSPTPLAPDMTLLPGVSPETLGIQAAPAPQAVGTQPPVPTFASQMEAPRLPSDVPVSPLPPVVPPAPTAASPDAMPPPAPQPPALMGLAAGSAALAAAELLHARQPQASPDDQTTPGDAGAAPTGVGLLLPLAAPPVPVAPPPAAPQQVSPALTGLAAGSAALAVADRFRASRSQPAPNGTPSTPTGIAPPLGGAVPSPMTVFMGSRADPAASNGTTDSSADSPLCRDAGDGGSSP